MTGRTGALLLVHLLGRPVDVRTVLDGVRAGLALGKLPADAAGKQIGARLETEDGLVELDRTGRLAFKRGDIELHHAFSSWASSRSSSAAAPLAPVRNEPGIGTSFGSFRFTASRM